MSIEFRKLSAGYKFFFPFTSALDLTPYWNNGYHLDGVADVSEDQQSRLIAGQSLTIVNVYLVLYSKYSRVGPLAIVVLLEPLH